MPPCLRHSPSSCMHVDARRSNGRLAALVAALDAEPSAIDRPHVGGLFDSRTLLMTAAAKGHVSIVEELLRRGADVSPTDKRGATAEALARKQGHAAIIALLVGPNSLAVKSERCGSEGDSAEALATAVGGAPAASPSSMAIRLHIGSSELLHTVVDAESVSLLSALETIGVQHEVQLRGVVHGMWCDALGKQLSASDLSSDVFSAWLEHGESKAGEFESDLHLWAPAPTANSAPASGVAPVDGPGEASSVYDILADDEDHSLHDSE